MSKQSSMPFGKKNYTLTALSFLLVIVGFVVMSLDNNVFGFMTLTLGPIIIVLGFALGFFAIFSKK